MPYLGDLAGIPSSPECICRKKNVYWSLREAALQSARLAGGWTSSTASLTSNTRLFFLFDTGKTELAKQTAKYIHKDVKKVTPPHFVVCLAECSVLGHAWCWDALGLLGCSTLHGNPV